MIAPAVIAVVVTYHPERETLEHLLCKLSQQVQHTVVIDNTPTPDNHLEWGEEAGQLTVRYLHRNMGIAHAQNVGVEEARRLGATHVMLMDQDSDPPVSMVQSLLRTLGSTSHMQVAAVGPVCLDIKTNQLTPLIQRQGWRLRRLKVQGLSTPVSVEYIPASGTLIPLPMWDLVGPVRADYFIDRVDVEWCLRARQQGLEVWVDPSTTMAHNQANRALEVLGRTLYLGHDFRAYFHVRNSIAMALWASVPSFWRWDQLLKTIPYALLHTAAAENGKFKMARLMVQAVWDGVRRRMGLGWYEKRPFLPTPTDAQR